MTTLEIILFIGLAIWIGAVVAKLDKLIRDIQNRLTDLEERLDESEEDELEYPSRGLDEY